MPKLQKTGGLVRGGDTKLVRDLVRDLAPSREKLLDAAMEIRLSPDATEAAYMARQLVQCTLPHSDPGDVPFWSRTNGRLSLGIVPGVNLPAQKSYGIPYGTIPRLLLFWVTTEAVRTKNKRLELGNTLSEFMRELGLDPRHGGKRSDAYRLREQMLRLFSARISFQQSLHSGDNEGTAWLNMDVTAKAELWWTPKRPDQATLWGSWVELGSAFFEAITAAPVPLDTRALRALKRSPLALDLYSLVTYRAFIASRKRAAQPLRWADLERQLGADYADAKNFRKKVAAALRKIQAVMPYLHLSKEPGGFTILANSLPSIKPA